MTEEDRRGNRAGEDFMDHKQVLADEERRRFVNSREALIDVLVAIEKDHSEMKWAPKLKKRVLAARSENELRLIMDGMLVLAGLVVRPQP
jgi:hypothetical protein